MTSAGYAQLVAYLKSMAAKNKGENFQTNQQAAGSSGNDALSFALKKAGPKATIGLQGPPYLHQWSQAERPGSYWR